MSHDPQLQEFQVVPADYTADFDALRLVRETVFVQEQQVPLDEEWDDLDPQCEHVLALDLQHRPIGTGRLTPGRKIGRMAVMKDWRGRGVGEALLLALMERARARGWDEVSLHAQVAAEGFYARAGFVPEGERFWEAGIEHVTMRRALEPLPLRPEGLGARPAPASQPVHEVTSLADAVDATVAVIETAPRSLVIYSRDGDLPLLGHARVIDALRVALTAHRDATLRVILQQTEDLGASHPLIALSQRLASRIELRSPTDPVDRREPGAWIAAERGGFFHRPLAHRFSGEASPMAPARAQQLIAAFDPVFERCEPCTQFRALGL